MASFKFGTIFIATLAWTLLLVSNGQIHVDEGKHPPVGGWKKISNLTDPSIIAIAEFAVEEAAKVNTHTSSLTFKRIRSGKYQQVGGINYRLLIEAQRAEEEKPKLYAAFVFVGLDKSKKLIYFRHVKNE
uniref:Cystatin domain-containing protein n=1 Tax=Kalanchoe fedtschenkoi TaxID=63787 RepID=A0A7N0UIJ2_KALFE